jgi:hypothetical protein
VAYSNFIGELLLNITLLLVLLWILNRFKDDLSKDDTLSRHSVDAHLNYSFVKMIFSSW